MYPEFVDDWFCTTRWCVKEIGQDCMWLQVDPKAIASDELYG